MHCPKCQVPILEKFTCCPNCGHDLSLFRSVQAMKADLAKVRSETLQVFRHLDLLEHRFSEFEGMVAGSSSSDQVAVPEKAEETTPVSFDESDLQATLGEETHTEISEQHTPKTPITLQEQYEAPSASDSGKTPQQKQQSEVLFGQKWLLIAGVVITVLGVGWFLKYSFDQNWIGPAGRVFLAYLWGMAFLGGGEFFRRKDFKHFGFCDLCGVPDLRPAAAIAGIFGDGGGHSAGLFAVVGVRYQMAGGSGADRWVFDAGDSQYGSGQSACVDELYGHPECWNFEYCVF